MLNVQHFMFHLIILVSLYIIIIIYIYYYLTLLIINYIIPFSANFYLGSSYVYYSVYSFANANYMKKHRNIDINSIFEKIYFIIFIIFIKKITKILY